MIYGSLTLHASVHTRPTKTIFLREQRRSLVDITVFHFLTGKWNRDEESSKLHSIPDWKLQVPVSGVCMVGKDLTGSRKMKVLA